MPPSPLDWLPAKHFVYFVLDVIGEMDISEIEDAIQAKDARGNAPFNPRMMVALLLYAYCVGLPSSRKIEKATHEDVAFRVLTGGQHPDHTVISEFRRVHLEALARIYLQVLRLCQQAGLVKFGHVALDGTKVQANASKHKAMSYERMLKSDAQLKAEIDKLFKAVEQQDTAEDARFGTDNVGDELPTELQRRQTRLAKIKQAKAALEAKAAETRAAELAERSERAKEAAEQAPKEEKQRADRRAKKIDGQAKAATDKAIDKAEKRCIQAREQTAAVQMNADNSRAGQAAVRAAERSEDAAHRDLDKLKRIDVQASPNSAALLPEHRVPADKNGDPRPKAQRNFTDPDSRIMKSGGGYVQGYNCQAAVDDGHQIIVACDVSNQPPDVEYLEPLVEQIERNCGGLPKKFTADAGYWSESNAQYCEAKGLDAYIAVSRDKHSPAAASGVSSPASPRTSKDAMRAKLQTDEGRAIYRRRKAVVEPVFGQQKEARGFRRFLLRGTDKVRGEWSLICAGHNLLKIFRAREAQTV